MECAEPRHIGGCSAAAGGVPRRCEEERLHTVFRCRSFRIVCIIQLLLRLVEHIDLHIACRGRCGHVDVIHKDTELPYSKVIHMLKLRHQACHAFVHCFLICEVNGLLHGRMRHPHKVYIALCGLLRILTHLVLGAQPQFCFFLRHFRGVFLIPLAEMIGIVLRSVEEGVHLISLCKIKPAQRSLHAPGITIISLHTPAVFLECILLKSRDLKLSVFRLIQHLLQRRQTVERGVGIFAEDHDISILKDLHHVHIVLVLTFFEHLSRNILQRIRGAS